MALINFNTVNVRGIRLQKKQNMLSSFLNRTLKLNTSSHIIALQECHILTNEKLPAFNHKFQYWNGNSTDARGVGFVSTMALKHEYRDDDGRILVMSVVIDDVCFNLLNIYAPCQTKASQKPFLIEIFRVTKKYKNIILFGDFNFYLNKRDSITQSKISRNSPLVKQFLLNFDLCDSAQISNKRITTWRPSGKNAIKEARLDYIFIPNNSINKLKRVRTYRWVFSDHSLYSISLILNGKTQRGRGFWRLNPQLLKDDIFN